MKTASEWLNTEGLHCQTMAEAAEGYTNYRLHPVVRILSELTNRVVGYGWKSAVVTCATANAVDRDMVERAEKVLDECPNEFKDRIICKIWVVPDEPDDLLADMDTDAGFLNWIKARLVNVYHEKPGVDFVLRLGRIVDNCKG